MIRRSSTRARSYRDRLVQFDNRSAAKCSVQPRDILGDSSHLLVWGRPAAWAAYSREVGGRIQGVAIFPAASNPNPTWWHSRDYGVIVANGFGKRVLPEAADGKLVVKRNDSLKLRYDVLLFDTPSAAPIDFPAAYRQLQSDSNRTR